MNPILIIIIAILVGSYCLHLLVEYLNLKHLSETVPAEFSDYYDREKYEKSQRYLRDNTRLDLLQSSIMTPILIAFILAGGFNLVDSFVRRFDFGTIVSGLFFTGILMIGGQLIQLPFSIYDTFVIEARYGFNKMTWKTYIGDLLKGLGIALVLGGLLLSGILWFFERHSEVAWLYAWGLVAAFQIIMMFLAPVVIMPMFNKFTPIEDGELKQSIESYARSQDFKLSGIFTMDGSKRSTKSNAYFTGFGKSRRIVLFDTLIENHNIDELIAILAHEMGHFKKRHIQIFVVISILLTGIMLFILSLFINNDQLFDAFRMEHKSVYASIVFFGFLYSPISMILSVFVNMISRHFEYEADAYASKTFGRTEPLINALKKLSTDNLTNLTPHQLKVFLEYSHPPVLNRIEALKRVAT